MKGLMVAPFVPVGELLEVVAHEQVAVNTSLPL